MRIFCGDQNKAKLLKFKPAQKVKQITLDELFKICIIKFFGF